MISYKIDDWLIRKLSKIIDLTSEKYSAMTKLDESTKEAMHRYAKISNLGASTRIENAVLTDTEIDWMDSVLSTDCRPDYFLRQKGMIEDKLSKDKERSIEEVAGLRNVLDMIYSQPMVFYPLRESTIRGLHGELLKYYPKAEPYLGRYKIASNSVVERQGDKITREILRTADPGPITEAAMRDLVVWYNEALLEYPWSLAVITEFVFRFLAIHPFQDGNGRMGRALYLLGVMQSPDKKLAAVLPYLAIDRQIEKNRSEYYLVLHMCSDGKFRQDPAEYKTQHFLNFMLKTFEQALTTDVDLYAKKHETFLQLTPALKTVLASFQGHPELRLMTKDVVHFTHLPRRTIVYSLAELYKRGFLQKLGRGSATHYQLIF